MKKAVAILVLFFYLLPAIGFSYSVHYCGGKAVKVNLGAVGDKACCSASVKAASCCKNVTVKASLKDTGLKERSVFPDLLRLADWLRLAAVSPGPMLPVVPEVRVAGWPPGLSPPSLSASLFLLIRVLRI